VKVVAALIVTIGFGMALLRVLDIRRLYSPVFTMDLPESTVRQSLLTGVLDSVFGGANVVFGISILAGKAWARSALVIWAILWAALFTAGTLMRFQLFDLRFESYAFLLCLAFFYFCACYLLWRGRRAAVGA
jgi:hypothetical protein